MIGMTATIKLNNHKKQLLNDINKKKVVKISRIGFSTELELYVKLNKVTYLDGLEQLCIEYNIDFESVARYITLSIKQKIAQEQNMTKSVFHIDSSLPIHK